MIWTSGKIGQFFKIFVVADTFCVNISNIEIMILTLGGDKHAS